MEFCIFHQIQPNYVREPIWPFGLVYKLFEIKPKPFQLLRQSSSLSCDASAAYLLGQATNNTGIGQGTSGNWHFIEVKIWN